MAEQLREQPLVVTALDESGQEKQGEATASVQRQYMGCAGRIANGVNTVHRTYATASGHALVGARLYVPADQVAGSARRAALGIHGSTGDCDGNNGGGLEFRTKPQLATDIPTDTRRSRPALCTTANSEGLTRRPELLGTVMSSRLRARERLLTCLKGVYKIKTAMICCRWQCSTACIGICDQSAEALEQLDFSSQSAARLLRGTSEEPDGEEG